MLYIIIGLSSLTIMLNIFILIFIILKQNNNQTTADKVSHLETTMAKEFGEFKVSLTKSLLEDFDHLNEKIDMRLRLINDHVNERLDQNFEKTNKTFASVLERLSKIDEAQKKIDHLSNDIVSLQSVLTDKKTRGIFGEVNLHNILNSVFGENDKIYQLQYPLENNTVVDCMLFAPEPLGQIAIDSKFPLENDAIASKYIIKGVTADQAILFLPAEAIFAETSAYHSDIIEYAYKKRVWITSPTTLISTLTTLQVMIKNMERDKYASIIHHELSLLDEEFKRYKDRWDKLSRSIDTVSKDVKEIHTTTNKITKRFDSINQVEIDNMKEGEQLNGVN